MVKDFGGSYHNIRTNEDVPSVVRRIFLIPPIVQNTFPAGV